MREKVSTSTKITMQRSRKNQIRRKENRRAPLRLMPDQLTGPIAEEIVCVPCARQQRKSVICCLLTPPTIFLHSLTSSSQARHIICQRRQAIPQVLTLPDVNYPLRETIYRCVEHYLHGSDNSAGGCLLAIINAPLHGTSIPKSASSTCDYSGICHQCVQQVKSIVHNNGSSRPWTRITIWTFPSFTSSHNNWKHE